MAIGWHFLNIHLIPPLESYVLKLYKRNYSFLQGVNIV